MRRVVFSEFADPPRPSALQWTPTAIVSAMKQIAVPFIFLETKENFGGL